MAIQVERAAVIERIYIIHGGEATAKTGPFSGFAAGVRYQVKQRFPLMPGEWPSVMHWAATHDFAVITSDRLAFAKPGLQDRSISWAEIEDIDGSDLEALMQRPAVKAESTLLRFTLMSGEIAQITVEPGKPFFGFWNAARQARTMGAWAAGIRS